MTVAGADSPVTLQSDPFYTPPAGWDSKAPGTVLNSRPVEVASMGPQALDADAWQLLYRSTDADGLPMATVTTVLRPRGGEIKGLVSYQAATDASAPQCAPSVALRQGAPDQYDSSLDLMTIEQVLSTGHAVSVPDWEGPKGVLFSARQPGYAILDGVRAAERFEPLALSGVDTPVAALGYSGGGFGTGWAAQVQPAYTPEVRLVGVAVGGGRAQLASYLKGLNAGPFAGFLPSLLPGVMRSDPRVATAFGNHLTPAGQALLARGDSKCVTANVGQNAMLNMDDYLTIPFSQVMDQIQTSIDSWEFQPESATPPMFVYNAVHDEIVAIAEADRMVAQWCAAGARITQVRDQLSEHVALAITGTAATLRWIDERLAGQPVPDGCATRTVTSMALDGA
ncbi:lipase family protein [Nocardia sp. NPDC005978]|uniref:lipase family protein n=1 Tax=Nocardia sp. NPDC005978 TaxID=3156725 RepID=UPI0033A2BF33